ncbi:MAG: hypothetical protein PHV68_00415 [Candidatus Gastranaerophilales bacterium]|nr:hypothetical protein [Candidatus Gastranaerophilales bacterium]
MKISPKIFKNYTPSKAMNTILNSRPMEYLTNPNAGAAAGIIGVASCVTKDAVNCYYYVTQSLKNKRIPEEKRKFVAALDLSNGLLNVAAQLAIGIPMAKKSGELFDKHVAPKLFSDKTLENVLNNIKKTGSCKNFTAEEFMRAFKKTKTVGKAGFCVILPLIGATIIAKRMVVPFLATPMASFFKKRFEANENTTKTDAQQNDVISFKQNKKIKKEVFSAFASN